MALRMSEGDIEERLTSCHTKTATRLMTICSSAGCSSEGEHVLSDEPGYYKDGHYGIRLETIMRVVKKGFNGVPADECKSSHSSTVGDVSN